MSIEKAISLKQSGDCNCAQAIAQAFASHTPLSAGQLRALASPFGMGMGCTQGTCGAIVGAGLILGLRYADRAKAQPAMRRLLEAFQAEAGATQCRRLKGIDTGRPLLHCDDCVALAARLLDAEIAAAPV
ncbi:MAG: C-GCAxxG-C-C family protein [Pseudoflavonifractor sp.]|nr:C-GCAxxG-C-C family protein [Alloprevotella sp.]MCM1116969.1 C-GCAxxG-C-C family protein [Pseudoflavonifractor sp.]